mgnify:CR=1 FL=1
MGVVIAIVATMVLGILALAVAAAVGFVRADVQTLNCFAPPGTPEPRRATRTRTAYRRSPDGTQVVTTETISIPITSARFPRTFSDFEKSSDPIRQDGRSGTKPQVAADLGRMASRTKTT